MYVHRHEGSRFSLHGIRDFEQHLTFALGDTQKTQKANEHNENKDIEIKRTDGKAMQHINNNRSQERMKVHTRVVARLSNSWRAVVAIVIKTKTVHD